MQNSIYELQNLESAVPSTTSMLPGINGLSAFCIPTLSPSVPTQQYYDNRHAECAVIAKRLIEIGVINPTCLPSNTYTVHQIVQHGMQDWLLQQVKQLTVLDVSMSILLPQSVENFIEGHNEYGYLEEVRSATGKFGLVIEGADYLNGFELESHAKHLENVHPGLFRTAMIAVEKASKMTVNLRSPEDLLWIFRMEWEVGTTIPKDEDVIDYLYDRFGTQDIDEVKAYLPSAVIPMLGGDLCLNLGKRGKTSAPSMTKKQLKEIAKASSDSVASQVATATLELNRLMVAAKNSKTSFPNLDGISAITLESGCTLFFNANQIIIDEIDCNARHAQETGEATTVIGIDELPDDAAELKTYFDQLAISLTVLSALDQLLALITTPYIHG